jgi:hypothetical protein
MKRQLQSTVWASLGILMLQALFLLVHFAGCRQSVVESPAGESPAVSSLEESHGVAAHKPHTFGEAVDALETRIRALSTTDSAGGRETITTKFTELADIVRWLPELAADSDLGRKDWSTAQGVAKRLETEMEGWSQRTTPLTAAELQKLLDGVPELKPLIPLSDRYRVTPQTHGGGAGAQGATAE